LNDVRQNWKQVQDKVEQNEEDLQNKEKDIGD
jgi:hypothetical protein